MANVAQIIIEAIDKVSGTMAIIRQSIENNFGSIEGMNKQFAQTAETAKRVVSEAMQIAPSLLPSQNVINAVEKGFEDTAKATETVRNGVQQITQVVETANRVTNDLQQGFANLERIGQDLQRMGTIGLSAFSGLTRAAGDYELELKRTLTVTGLAGEEFLKMEKPVKDLARTFSEEFGTSGVDTMKAFYYTLSSGVEVGSKGFQTLTDAALKLNKVTKLDLSEGVEILSDTTKTFGFEMEKSAHIAEVFFKASNIGSLDVKQIAESMKTAGNAAATMGVSLEDTAAMLVALGDKGLKAAVAGEQLKIIMLQIGADKEAKRALDALGISAYDSSGKLKPMLDILTQIKTATAKLTEEERNHYLTQIAGKEGFKSLSAIMTSNIDKIKEYSKQMKESATLEEAWKRVKESLSIQTDIMKTKLAGLGRTIGESVIPELVKISQKLGDAITAMRNYIDKHPELAKTIVVWGSIGSAMSIALGTSVIAFAKLGALMAGLPAQIASVKASMTAIGAFFVGNPIILGITGIVIALGGLYAAWKTNFLGIKDLTDQILPDLKANWEKFALSIKETWVNIINEVKPILKAFTDSMQTEFNIFRVGFGDNMKQFSKEFKELWESMRTAVEPIMPAIKAIFNVYVKLWIEEFKLFFEYIKVSFQVFTWLLNEVIMPFYTGLVKITKDSLNFVTKEIQTWVGYVKFRFQEAQEIIKNFSNAIERAFENLMIALRNLNKPLANAINNLLALKDLLGLTKEKADKYSESLKNATNSTSNFGKSFVDSFQKGVETGVDGFNKLTAQIPNAIKGFNDFTKSLQTQALITKANTVNITEFLGTFGKIQKLHEDYQKTQKIAQEANKKYQESLERVKIEQQDLEVATYKSKKALEELNKITNTANKTKADYEKRMKELGLSTDFFKVKTDEVVNSQKKQVDISAKIVDSYKQAGIETLKYQKALEQSSGNIDKFKKVLQEQGVSQDKITKFFEANEGAAKEYFQKLSEANDVYNNLNIQNNNLQGSQTKYNTAVKEAKKAEEELKLAQQQAQEFKKNYDNAVKESKKHLDAYKKAIDEASESNKNNLYKTLENVKIPAGLFKTAITNCHGSLEEFVRLIKAGGVNDQAMVNLFKKLDLWKEKVDNIIKKLNDLANAQSKVSGLESKDSSSGKGFSSSSSSSSSKSKSSSNSSGSGSNSSVNINVEGNVYGGDSGLRELVRKLKKYSDEEASRAASTKAFKGV